jgi:hypothetical protein
LPGGSLPLRRGAGIDRLTFVRDSGAPIRTQLRSSSIGAFHSIAHDVLDAAALDFKRMSLR